MLASQLGQIEIVDYLLQNGAQVDRTDLESKTALHYSVESRADNVDVVEMLVPRYTRIDGADECGNTALHYAAMNGHYESAKTLIANGANKDIKNK
jgi:ankyrin repeat protein